MGAVEIISNIHYFESLSYIGIFVALLLSGHFVPIPQDVSLIILGYIVAHGYASVPPMIVVALLAAVAGDSALYWIARSGSSFGQKIEAKIKNNVFEFIKNHLKKHTFPTIFVARFIPGLRFTSAVVSGYIGIDWKKFFAYNAFSACFYVPFYFSVGYFLQHRIDGIISAVDWARHAIVIGIAVIFCVVVAWVLGRKVFNRGDSTPLT